MSTLINPWRRAILVEAERMCRGGAETPEVRTLTTAALGLAALAAPKGERMTWFGLAVHWNTGIPADVVAASPVRALLLHMRNRVSGANR